MDEFSCSFFLFECAGYSYGTVGSLDVDVNMNVLTKDGKPITNLFAVGQDSEGLEINLVQHIHHGVVRHSLGHLYLVKLLVSKRLRLLTKQNRYSQKKNFTSMKFFFSKNPYQRVIWIV